MAHVALADDDPELARRHSAEAMAEWSNLRFGVENSYALQGLVVADLYAGDLEAAERRMEESWQRIVNAMLLSFEVTRVSLTHLRGRAALACAARASTGDREPLLRKTIRQARALRKDLAVSAPALGQLLEAGVAHVRGDVGGASIALDAAGAALDASDLKLFAAAVRWQRGQLLGGDEGAALIANARAFMSAQGILKPEKFAALFVPGFAGA
jgi:hypothetical protein